MQMDYGKRVLKHYEVQSGTALKLLEIAQGLCPGTWVLQILANLDQANGKHVLVYQVSVTNGDDNVTASNQNLGAALAQLIYYLLNGSVFPLTGDGGVYYHPADRGWIEPESSGKEG